MNNEGRVARHQCAKCAFVLYALPDDVWDYLNQLRGWYLELNESGNIVALCPYCRPHNPREETKETSNDGRFATSFD